MPPGTLKDSRPRNLGSSENPMTIDSDDDSDGDAISGDDEEYMAPGHKRSASRGKRRQSTAAAQAPRSSTKRKKSLGEPEEVDDGYNDTRNPSHYRQPAVWIIPNIKQDPTWKEGYDQVSKAVDGGRLDRAAMRRERITHNRLIEEDVQWGIVEKGKGKQADGRCRTCISRGKACVAQLNEGGTNGGPYQLISSCIRCLVSHTSCDLLLPRVTPGTKHTSSKTIPTPSKHVPTYQTPNVKPVKPKSISKPAMNPPVRPPPSSSTATPIKAPPELSSSRTPDVRDRKSKISSPSQPKVAKAKVDKPRASQGSSSGPAVDKKDAIAAVNDMTDFVEHMRELASAGGGMKDLATRGMFQLVDKQVEVLKRYAKQIE